MDKFWLDLLQKLLVAALTVLAPLLVGLVYTMLRQRWAQFKNDQPQWAYAFEQAASMAVKAAEQAGASGFIKDKKEYALKIAEKWLAANGVPLDLDLIDAAIEAAVFEELNKEKLSAHAQAGA